MLLKMNGVKARESENISEKDVIIKLAKEAVQRKWVVKLSRIPKKKLQKILNERSNKIKIERKRKVKVNKIMNSDLNAGFSYIMIDILNELNC